MVPIITFQMEGASIQQVEHCRQIIVKCFDSGMFNIKRGKAVLSFDHTGELGSIEITELRYRGGDAKLTAK